MITREQCLKWAEEVAAPNSPIDGNRVVLYRDEIEALCQRVWNEAIEAAAKLTAERFDEMEPWMTPDEVRELKVMK